jgi:hypothetical protein
MKTDRPHAEEESGGVHGVAAIGHLDLDLGRFDVPEARSGQHAVKESIGQREYAGGAGLDWPGPRIER